MKILIDKVKVGVGIVDQAERAFESLARIQREPYVWHGGIEEHGDFLDEQRRLIPFGVRGHNRLQSHHQLARIGLGQGKFDVVGEQLGAIEPAEGQARIAPPCGRLASGQHERIATLTICRSSRIAIRAAGNVIFIVQVR